MYKHPRQPRSNIYKHPRQPPSNKYKHSPWVVSFGTVTNHYCGVRAVRHKSINDSTNPKHKQNTSGNSLWRHSYYCSRAENTGLRCFTDSTMRPRPTFARIVRCRSHSVPQTLHPSTRTETSLSGRGTSVHEPEMYTDLSPRGQSAPI